MNPRITRTVPRIIALIAALGIIASLLSSLASASTQPIVCAEQPLRGVNGTVWVTDRTGHRVFVYDAGRRLCLVKEIGLAGGLNPIGIIGAGGDRIYVSNEDTGSVSVISRHTLSAVKTIRVGPKPHHMHASRDGRYLYVAEYGRNSVAVIDTDTDEQISASPFQMSANPAVMTHAPWATADGRFVYSANQLPKVGGADVPGEVGVVDAETGELRDTFATFGNLPSEVLVSRNGKRAFVSLRASGTIEIWEAHAPRLLDVVDLNYEAGKSAEPDTLQVTPGTRQLIATLRQRAAVGASTVRGVAIIDLRDCNALRYAEMVATTTGHHWLTPNGRYSFVAIEGNAQAAAAVVDNRHAQTIAYLPLPGTSATRPHGVFFEPRRLRLHDWHREE